MEKLSEATRLLEGLNRDLDPEQRIQEFEIGLGLLDKYMRDNPDLGVQDRQRIKDVRTSCTRRLLELLPDFQGGPVGPWLDTVGVLLVKMKPEVDAILRGYSENAILFPRPLDGAVVEISPPGLAWLPFGDIARYHVEIRDSTGILVYEKTVGSDPVHLPDQVLPAGAYTWDVIGLDAQGYEGARRGTWSFVVPAGVPELPWMEPSTLLDRVPGEHPRFLYPQWELARVRAALETSHKQASEALLAAAERALEIKPPAYPRYHLATDRMQAKLEYVDYVAAFERAIDEALLDLSLAFLVTKKAEYAEAAKRILLEVADWPCDDNDVTSISSRWGDGPGLSLARCAHRAYDWLYEALSSEERAKVRATCEARAWQAHRRLQRCNYLTYPGESHNGRLILYLAEMAIVLAAESEGARTWLDYSLKALTTFYPHWGGHDGGWAEGPAYGLWYNKLTIPTLETLRQTTGFDLWKRPFFRKVRFFFFYCTALRGEISPFGDGAESVGPGIDQGSGYAQLLSYHAQRYDDAYVGWWAKQVGGWDGYDRELCLGLGNTVGAKSPTDLPGSRVFYDIGWAALHSDLSDPEEDTFLLFKSSPFGSVSHSHADQNGFCIMKGGRALAIPSGYYWPWAGMPHHVEWTCSTKANNCVLVNGEGQAIRERKAGGWIKAFEDRAGLSFVAGDAAAAYMGKVRRFDRHILFLRPGLFLLLDDLEAPQPALFQWMLHAFEEMEVEHTSGRVITHRRGTTLDVWLRSPAGLNLSQTDQFDTPCNSGLPKADHREMARHWHLTAETKQGARSLRIGAVMAVRGPGERFELEVYEQAGWFGAQARGRFGTAAGWVQMQPGARGPEGYGEAVTKGQATVCGVSADGDRFVR